MFSTLFVPMSALFVFHGLYRPLLSPVILLPSGYCQFVLYFNVSGYILLACLFY